MPNDALTAEQRAALDDMVARRVANTGETEEESRRYIANYLRGAASLS